MMMMRKMEKKHTLGEVSGSEEMKRSYHLHESKAKNAHQANFLLAMYVELEQDGKR